MTKRPIIKSISIYIALAAMFIALPPAFMGCVSTSPVLTPGRTIPPTPEPTIEIVQTPEPEPTPTLTPPPFGLYDAIGEYIGSARHYERYIEFRNIQVYDQCGDTFIDAVVINPYPQTLICAVDIFFYGEDGAIIADGKLQTRDGQYVLRLAPGETTLFARVDTDTVLTDKEFGLYFDDALNVMPDAANQ